MKEAATGAALGAEVAHTPELDGVRGIALLAVLALHVTYVAISGGALGVDLFFVLSGFLITRLLLAELERTGSIHFRRFFVRRAGRLYPALLVALVLAYLVWDLTEPGREVPFSGALFPVAFYYANYVDPKVLGPLITAWSLAVEEHCYFVWPFLLTLLVPRGRRVLYASLAAFVAVAFLYRQVLYVPGSNWPAYAHTLARLDSLALGAALAASGVTRAPSPALRKAAGIFGPAALAVFGLLVLFSAHQATWLFRGGYTFVAALGALIILGASTAEASSVYARVLRFPVLRWFGTRSYGIYLFHMPIVHALENLRVAGNNENFALVLLLRVGLSALVAELSFRLVEAPLRAASRRAFSTRKAPIVGVASST